MPQLRTQADIDEIYGLQDSYAEDKTEALGWGLDLAARPAVS